jgi:hypothetical protein
MERRRPEIMDRKFLKIWYQKSSDAIIETAAKIINPNIPQAINSLERFHS